MINIKTALALFFACAGVSILLMPTKPQTNVAVFGRTLRPCVPPNCAEQLIVVNKRTSLSGEGTFVK